jgi:hypothetical protein
MERRQPLPPVWQRFHRRGDFSRNPLVLAVVGGLLVNACWAGVLYAYAYAVEQSREYWKHYGAGIAAEARTTNNPDKLREIVQRVQEARSK